MRRKILTTLLYALGMAAVMGATYLAAKYFLEMTQ